MLSIEKLPLDALLLNALYYSSLTFKATNLHAQALNYVLRAENNENSELNNWSTTLKLMGGSSLLVIHPFLY